MLSMLRWPPRSTSSTSWRCVRATRRTRTRPTPWAAAPSRCAACVHCAWLCRFITGRGGHRGLLHPQSSARIVLPGFWPVLEPLHSSLGPVSFSMASHNLGFFPLSPAQVENVQCITQSPNKQRFINAAPSHSLTHLPRWGAWSASHQSTVSPIKS